MKKLILKIALVLFIFALGIGLYAGSLQLIGNFHTVIPNELYRSAQLDAEDIAKYKADYGINSILNLRGENLDEDWYVSEINEARKQNIKHIDFRMSAKRELNQEQVEQLLKIMADAPKPLLVHCMGGSDRSGLASAFYLAGVKKADEEAAEAQLSIYYGHFYLIFNGAAAMDETFERFEEYFGYYGS